MKKETSINGKVVTVTCSTKRDKVDYDCEFVFDFGKCTDTELLKLATRSLVIDKQRAIRDVKELNDAKKLLKQKVDVHDDLAGRTRVRKSTDEKVAALLKDYSEEERKALIEAVQAKLKG